MTDRIGEALCEWTFLGGLDGHDASVVLAEEIYRPLGMISVEEADKLHNENVRLRRMLNYVCTLAHHRGLLKPLRHRLGMDKKLSLHEQVREHYRNLEEGERGDD